MPISDWAFAELNVPPYPEKRVFKRIAKNICKIADEPREVELVMRGRWSWFAIYDRQTLSCAQLN
ncbi:MAG TPA: hypothetical protein PKD37_03565 [Oligoflexia bacterium]|nr:hypothetical protein [Oligoflexia bacterium]HMP27047.1 hypothetical protein [Oligoflexia bacterium]